MISVLLICVMSGLMAQAASFDCAKASSEVEHLICGDPELSQLDEELAQAYRQALNQTNENEYIREWQRYWLSFVREDCYAAPCLLDAYRLQIQELNEHAEELEENGAALSGIYDRYYQGTLDSDTAVLQLVELKNQRVRLIGKAYWVNDPKKGHPLPHLPYSSSTKAVIQHHDEHFLSIESYSQGFSGGAHGWYFQQDFNYDLQADCQIQLQDLFQAESAYRAKILHSFFKSLQEEEGPGLDELLFNALEPGQPDFAQEFTMSVLGLKIFLHNVFPHVVGSLVYVEISWEELQAYLKADIYRHFTGAPLISIF